MTPPTLLPGELNALLQRGEHAVVIDVRTPVEFSEVHAENAVNVPLDRFTPDEVAKAGCKDCNAPVYLLCLSGQRATKAAQKLAAAGYTRPVVITGGTQAWIDAGLPVVRGTSRVISLERQVRIAAGSLVFIGVLLAHFVHPGFMWLAGFVGAGLVFAGISGFCGMGLLIAKLPWNQRAG